MPSAENDRMGEPDAARKRGDRGTMPDMAGRPVTRASREASTAETHLSPEWAEVAACTARAALALRALDVAIRAYAAARPIPGADR